MISFPCFSNVFILFSFASLWLTSSSGLSNRSKKRGTLLNRVVSLLDTSRLLTDSFVFELRGQFFSRQEYRHVTAQVADQKASSHPIEHHGTAGQQFNVDRMAPNYANRRTLSLHSHVTEPTTRRKSTGTPHDSIPFANARETRATRSGRLYTDGPFETTVQLCSIDSTSDRQFDDATHDAEWNLSMDHRYLPVFSHGTSEVEGSSRMFASPEILIFIVSELHSSQSLLEQVFQAIAEKYQRSWQSTLNWNAGSLTFLCFFRVPIGQWLNSTAIPHTRHRPVKER